MICMGMAAAVGAHQLAQTALFPALGDPTIISKDDMGDSDHRDRGG